MNGSRKVPKTSQTIREYHIHEISRNPHIQNIPIACKKDNDHRKMLFFFESKGWSFGSVLNLMNYKMGIQGNIPDLVLFESLNGPEDPHSYLKKILEDFLMNSLT